jgi:hypothetical protein
VSHDPILPPLPAAHARKITVCGVLEIGEGSEEGAGGPTQKIMNMIAANPSISREEFAEQIDAIAVNLKNSKNPTIGKIFTRYQTELKQGPATEFTKVACGKVLEEGSGKKRISEEKS